MSCRAVGVWYPSFSTLFDKEENVKVVGRFLLGMLVMFVFSGAVYAGNTAGVFQLPYDPNQHWKYSDGSDCPYIGYKSPADQIFMQLNPVGYQGGPAYHLAEDWNGKCGHSTDLGAVLYAVADGFVEAVDDTTANNSFGKLLLIRHPLPDGTSRYVLYEHILDIEVNSRTGTQFKVGDPVYIGDTVARIGDGNGSYPNAAHLHFEMRRGLFATLAADPYYPILSVSTALKYSSPSLFIDDRRFPFTQSLTNGAWTYLAWYLNAPSSTAFIEYHGERYSLPRAVQLGYIYQYVYEQRSGQWYYYPDIANVFFGAGNTYAIWSFVNGAVLNIFVPGSNFPGDRAKIDMIHAVSGNGNFKSVKPDVFQLYTSDQSFDYRYMQFTYNNGSGDQAVYANQATLKSNPLVRYTTYYDPATGQWTAWTQVNPNTLD